MGSAQRTKTQKFMVDSTKPKKMLASKVSAIETVFIFVENTYHTYWKSESDYDSEYKAPSAKQIEESLVAMETRLSSMSKSKWQVPALQSRNGKGMSHCVAKQDITGVGEKIGNRSWGRETAERIQVGVNYRSRYLSTCVSLQAFLRVTYPDPYPQTPPPGYPINIISLWWK